MLRRLTLPLAVAGLACLGASASSAIGQVDARRYVALGDSLTAGFAAGGLHRQGQLSGYALRLAHHIGGPDAVFEQPLMSDPGIPAAFRLEAGSPPALIPASGLGSPINLTLERPYDNLAVPGARIGDVLRSQGDGGGLQDLVLRGLGTQLEQALLLEPTFVSLWVGLSDALGAAVSGVVLDGITLTAAERFDADFAELVQRLAASGVSAGVVATIPHVSDLPFVTAISTMAVDGDGVPIRRLGPDGPLEKGDYVLMTASPLLQRGYGVAETDGGSGHPLPDEVVLSRSEVAAINERIDSYNAAIRRAAGDVGFAVAETAALFEQWHTNGAGDGYSQEAAFSLDGIHPSPLGHRLLARVFVEAMERTYKIGTLRSQADLQPRAAENGVEGRARLPSARFVFTRRAAKSLRFGLGVPRPARLLRMKRRRLDAAPTPGGGPAPRRVYELPAAPVLAGWLERVPAGVRLVGDREAT